MDPLPTPRQTDSVPRTFLATGPLGSGALVPLDQAPAHGLYDAVLTDAWVLYEARPTLLTTDRRGALEGGWRLKVHDGTYVPVAEEPMGATALMVERSGLTRLIHAYCDHPDVDPHLFTRNVRFPQSVELYIG